METTTYPTPLSNEIGNNIKKLRCDRKITQVQLADRLGTKQPSISRIESGEYIPSFSFLQRLADELGAKIKVEMA